MEWYAHDFSKSKQELLTWIQSFVSRIELNEVIRENYAIQYQHFDWDFAFYCSGTPAQLALSPSIAAASPSRTQSSSSLTSSSGSAASFASLSSSPPPMQRQSSAERAVIQLPILHHLQDILTSGRRGDFKLIESRYWHLPDPVNSVVNIE
jgi:hypothetical protein